MMPYQLKEITDRSERLLDMEMDKLRVDPAFGCIIPEDRQLHCFLESDVPALLAEIKKAWAEIDRLKATIQLFIDITRENEGSAAEYCKKMQDIIDAIKEKQRG
ncbi:MAG: hypothetical protein M0Q12_00225 [Synergistaceae bacterium]|jgi:hypothetical protein|nr:hypothetical protein [Synergistaceae bacterium]